MTRALVLCLSLIWAGAARADGLPVPPDVKPHLEQALRVGRALYAQDFVSARGTDILRENVPSMSGLGGYFTIQEGDDDARPKDSWLVQFFTNAPEPLIAYRIRLWPGQ